LLFYIFFSLVPGLPFKISIFFVQKFGHSSKWLIPLKKFITFNPLNWPVMSGLCGVYRIKQRLDPALLEMSGVETLREIFVVGFNF